MDGWIDCPPEQSKSRQRVEMDRFQYQMEGGRAPHIVKPTRHMIDRQITLRVFPEQLDGQMDKSTPIID